MTQRDKEILDMFCEGVKADNVLVCSPSTEQIEILERHFKNVSVSLISDWDITKIILLNKYDLIVCNNVFHYIDNPEVALWNVLSSCKQFIMQDLICRQRRIDGELGTDGDCMRYSLFDDKAKLQNAFDLTAYSGRIKKHTAYFDSQSLHFIALFKGFV